ncbi:MAG: acylphosphatase [Gammaproteobacteria bacterium]
MEAAIHCFVQGRVQGVFFRASTRDEALRLGLTGWVRNLADGSVEVFACGRQADLDRLREWLARGPARARVEQLRCGPGEPERFDGFQVR